jgi:hypothetical protein
MIREVLVMCKIMKNDSDDTSTHKELSESDRQVVFKERLFGVGGLPSLLSLRILFYSKASDNI